MIEYWIPGIEMCSPLKSVFTLLIFQNFNIALTSQLYKNIIAILTRLSTLYYRRQTHIGQSLLKWQVMWSWQKLVIRFLIGSKENNGLKTFVVTYMTRHFLVFFLYKWDKVFPVTVMQKLPPVMKYVTL